VYVKEEEEEEEEERFSGGRHISLNRPMSICGNGIDAYPVKRAFTHFSAQ